jgi:hypothetical protein
MVDKKRPMLAKIGDSTFDKIKAFYINPEEFPLSDKLEEIRCRWVAINNFSSKAYGKIEIANMLKRDYGISQAQAYIDIRNSENIFGSITSTESNAFKAMWIEWTKDYLKRCRQKDDRVNEAKALVLLAQYGDLKKDDLEFNPAKLENKELQLVIPKDQIELLKKLVSKGVVDFNNLNVTDVNYEEVK